MQRLSFSEMDIGMYFSGIGPTADCRVFRKVNEKEYMYVRDEYDISRGTIHMMLDMKVKCPILGTDLIVIPECYVN